MNIGQIQVLVQYPCGEVITVLVPSMVVDTPVVSTPALLSISECPMNEIVNPIIEPITYVSHPYPVINREGLSANALIMNAVVLDVIVNIDYGIEGIAANAGITNALLKNVVVNQPTNESVKSDATIIVGSVRQLNVTASTSDGIGSNSTIINGNLRNLNITVPINDGVYAQGTIINGELVSTPVTLLDDSYDSAESISPQLVSASIEEMVLKNHLSSDYDSITNTVVLSSIDSITFTPLLVPNDGYESATCTTALTSIEMITLNPITIGSESIESSIAIVPEFVSGVLIDV